MGRDKKQPDAPLLIQGNFKPGRGLRVVRFVTLLLGVVFVVAIVASLGVYALVVHYQSEINTTGEHTRQLHEENKGLQVRLNQIRSYQNVAAASAGVPHLHEAENVIEVDVRNRHVELAKPPQRTEEPPRVYGY